MSLLLRGTLLLDKRENLEIEGEYDAVFGAAIADSSEFSIRAGESVAIVHYGDENEVNHPFAIKADHIFCCYGLRSTSPKVRSLWLGKTECEYQHINTGTFVKVYEVGT